MPGKGQRVRRWRGGKKGSPEGRELRRIVTIPILRFRWIVTFSFFDPLLFIADARSIISIRAGDLLRTRLNLLAIGLGFIFQSAFLSLRGHELGRCPLTNLFEVFIFLAWSVALIYMLVGPAYRLSLMGAFTAPLVVVLQGFALLAPIDIRHPSRVPPNSWLHFYAFHVARRLWRLRPGLRCGDYVSGPRTPS